MLVRFALALCSAALIATAARPLVPGFLAWVAFLPLLMALYGETRSARAALLGATAALGAGVVGFVGAAPVALWAYPALVLLSTLPYAIAAGLWAFARARLGDTLALIAFPLAFTAAEYLPLQRGLWGDFADAITPIATTQFDTPLRLLAAWSSTSAVTLAVLAINAALFASLAARRPHPATLLAPAIVAFSLVPVPGVGERAVEVTPLRVAIVQGGIPGVETLFARFDDQAMLAMLAAHAELTARAAAAGAQLVVWGETAVPKPWDPAQPPEALLAALEGVPTALFGAVTFDGTRSYNSLMYAEGGVITEVYRKRALVPINERQYTPGATSPALAVAGRGVGLGICLDSLYAPFTREAVLRGAQLLVVATDDGFAGRTLTPELHLRASALRAIETGRYLIFANQSGPSAVIDARGQVVDRLASAERAALLVSVPSHRGLTPYVRFGDTVGPLAWLLATVLLVSAFTTPERVGPVAAPPRASRNRRP
jgi:apolipoprotein N-acyltransferase